MSLLVLLAACTDDGGDRPAERTTSTRPSDEVVDGGTVRVGLGGALVVDPLAANPADPADLMVLDLLHDGLTRNDGDGIAQPAVARSWRHDGTFTSWTFELDPAATYASGAPVTNADVAASLQRVVAAGPTSLSALRLEAVTAVTAAEDGTVQITLSGPVATLPTILGAPELGIVDVDGLAAATAAGGSLDDLDLSGSWDVAEGGGDELELARRDGRDGHLDGVMLHAYDDAPAAYEAFVDGDVDWALVPPAEHDEAVEAYGDDHFAPFHAEVFLGLRLGSPLLATPHLRGAIRAAIDRDAIVEEVYADRADVLASVVPAGVPGHADDRCPDEGCEHDRAAARAAVALAFPDGNVPAVPIDFDESPTQRALAELVAEQLDAVGIPTELRARPLAEYKAFLTSGGQEVFSFGWIGGYPSPDAYLAPLFASLSDDNLTGVSAAPVDQALVAARSTDDAGAAAEHWAAVESHVLREAVVIPIAQFRTQPVLAPRVRGLAHAVDGSVDWAAVWVTDGAS